LFSVQPTKIGKTLVVVCNKCGKSWSIKVDFLPKRECSKCRSTLFLIHNPPPHTPTKEAIVYLVCNQCRALQELKFGQLREVDASSVFTKA
jgi:hypothetical protein